MSPTEVPPSQSADHVSPTDVPCVQSSQHSSPIEESQDEEEKEKYMEGQFVIVSMMSNRM